LLDKEIETVEEAELIDYFNAMWKRRRMIVLGSLICMAVAFSVSLFLPKTYEASAIIEIGGIYSDGEGGVQSRIDIIEDSNTVAEVLLSDDMVSKLKAKLNSDLTLKALKDKIKVRGEKPKTPSSRFLEISLQLTNPQQAVVGVNFLGAQLMEEHGKIYDRLLNRLGEELAALAEKDKSNDAQIKTDIGYRAILKEQIEKEMSSANATKKEFSKLNTSQMNPPEILFLQESLRIQEIHLSELTKEMNDISLRIQEREKQNQDLRINMARLEHQKSMSENTKIRSTPVVPDRPVSPRVLLNAAIAGISSLVLLIMLSFSLEYIEKAKAKERKGMG